MKITALLVCMAIEGSAFAQVSDEEASKAARDRSLELYRKVDALPDVDHEDASRAVDAALVVETAQAPAELLLAIAWGESRYKASTITGHACGPMQTIPSKHISCQAMQIPLIGFAAGAAELRSWLRVAHGDLRLALLAYACGNSAFDGTCKKTAWPGWVLHRARRLGLEARGALAPMLRVSADQVGMPSTPL